MPELLELSDLDVDQQRIVVHLIELLWKTGEKMRQTSGTPSWLMVSVWMSCLVASLSGAPDDERQWYVDNVTRMLRDALTGLEAMPSGTHGHA